MMNAKIDKNVEEEEEFDTEVLARLIAELTWELKALNTVVIDLRGRVAYTDFVIVTTASSERHVNAVAKLVEHEVKQQMGVMVYGSEGLETGTWALLDFGDAILHVFNGSARDDYDLERMWAEAPRLELEDKPETLYGHHDMDQFDH